MKLHDPETDEALLADPRDRVAQLEARMRDRAIKLIDAGLGIYPKRNLVGGDEVTDLLLDIRETLTLDVKVYFPEVAGAPA